MESSSSGFCGFQLHSDPDSLGNDKFGKFAKCHEPPQRESQCDSYRLSTQLLLGEPAPAFPPHASPPASPQPAEYLRSLPLSHLPHPALTAAPTQRQFLKKESHRHSHTRPPVPMLLPARVQVPFGQPTFSTSTAPRRPLALRHTYLGVSRPLPRLLSLEPQGELVPEPCPRTAEPTLPIQAAVRHATRAGSVSRPAPVHKSRRQQPSRGACAASRPPEGRSCSEPPQPLLPPSLALEQTFQASLPLVDATHVW